MTVKEASERFDISHKELYALGKLHLCGITKRKNKWDIPDNTELLISVTDIKRFLFQIMLFKNNSGYQFPRDLCGDTRALKCIINQQYDNGFISNKAKGKTADKILKNVILTDVGISFALGKKLYNQLTVQLALKVNIESINFGLINIKA